MDDLSGLTEYANLFPSASPPVDDLSTPDELAGLSPDRSANSSVDDLSNVTLIRDLWSLGNSPVDDAGGEHQGPGRLLSTEPDSGGPERTTPDQHGSGTPAGNPVDKPDSVLDDSSKSDAGRSDAPTADNAKPGSQSPDPSKSGGDRPDGKQVDGVTPDGGGKITGPAGPHYTHARFGLAGFAHIAGHAKRGGPGSSVTFRVTGEDGGSQTLRVSNENGDIVVRDAQSGQEVGFPRDDDDDKWFEYTPSPTNQIRVPDAEAPKSDAGRSEAPTADNAKPGSQSPDPSKSGGDRPDSKQVDGVTPDGGHKITGAAGPHYPRAGYGLAAFADIAVEAKRGGPGSFVTFRVTGGDGGSQNLQAGVENGDIVIRDAQSGQVVGFPRGDDKWFEYTPSPTNQNPAPKPETSTDYGTEESGAPADDAEGGRGRHSGGRGSSPDGGREEPEFGASVDKPDSARNDGSTPDDEGRSGRQQRYGRYRGGRPSAPAGAQSEGSEHATPDQHGPDQSTPYEQVPQASGFSLGRSGVWRLLCGRPRVEGEPEGSMANLSMGDPVASPADPPMADPSMADDPLDPFAGLSPTPAFGNASGPPRPGDGPARDGDSTRDGQNQPTSGRPDAPVPGTPDGRPGQIPPGQTSRDARPNQTPPAARPKPPAPEAPAGKRKASGPPPQDNSDSNPARNKKRKNEPDHEGLAALHLNDSNGSSSSASSASTSAPPPKHDDDAMDVDKEPYSDPQDRGDSDTSQQEQEGKHTLDAEKEGSKEYGIPPDKLQDELRRDRDVHRIPLDRVHDNLGRWANDGSLAQVLRASTGDAISPSPDAGKGPRAFTQSDLEHRLPGFKDLDRGERLAVVSSLARLSVGFHEQHGVGKNPEHIDKPYRNKDEGDPMENTKDSVAKNSDESLGVRGHRKSSEKFLDNLKANGNMPPSLQHNSPDLTDRNYAVLEVEGPPPERETHYVTNSSVPVGEKYVSGRHSEKHLADWLKRVNQGDKECTPKSVYTEREPCGNGRGHAKCSTVLRGKALDDTKVYYSTTYRTDPEDVAAKKKLDTEKKVEKKKVDKMVPTEVRKNLEDRINSRTDSSAEWKAKKIAAAKAKSDADVRDDLREDVDREFKKRKEDATTDAKHAMVREMDRHIDHLDSIWSKIQPSLM
ncbi:hypothetical protein [Streptomyces glebosus]|uniref:hypothetical protein n=1 Tax=Streptomyces glebosus TaxID=249580 RepID=UPI00167EA088|nr:hypothetical protein [Streptomyces glebosus]